MASKIAPLDNDLAATLKRSYGVVVDRREPLGGGYGSAVCVRAARDVVLRLSPPGTARASLEFEHALVRELHRSCPAVVAPVVAHDGSTHFEHRGWSVTVLPFVAGRVASTCRPLPHAEAGHLLGAIHALSARLGHCAPRPGVPCLRGIDPLANAWWRWQSIEAFLRSSGAGPIAPELGSLRAAVDWLCQAVESVERTRPELPFRAVHGDYHPGNLLVSGGRVVAVLDWELARLDWLLFELVSALWEFCRTGGGAIDRDAARTFLAGYRRAGGDVQAWEPALAMTLLRARILVEVLVALARAAAGGPYDADRQLANYVAFRRLADADLEL